MHAKAVVLAVALAAAGAWAQASAPAPGTAIPVQLKTRLDSGHAKVGDRIKAQVTENVKLHDVLVLRRGTQIFGRVTEVVKAESKKSPSHIGVLFTRAVYKKQPPLAFHAGIERILSLPARPMDMGPDMGMPMPLPQPGMNNGDQSGGSDQRMNRPGSLGTEAVPNQVTAAVPSSAGPRQPDLKVSIFLPNGLASPSQKAAGSVLSSPRGDLKLDAGTRVLLRVLH